ncbi:S-adenosyl-L-methionine-dependent methyltransferase [Jaminaea rosea]|uniref:S-adenosyl-L-methionine-dependent methyltransferase n=1 Tax=Jaminaea rosea TaxID=1569628 RepID=A0A316UYW5_9BASI|nr:S-adenosyl-L-methionine-dependent methyltransferase [Jaminaea rosea]PWN30476.1 S-adenosyl-L-methionine-dependent methyltransferase [Jaminaea rosea]
MSAEQAFGDASFNVERYLSNRPRYPEHLYEWIRRYVARNAALSPPAERTLLDLGCGPGFAAFPLLRDYARKELIGIDTGKGMVETAPKALTAWVAQNRGQMEGINSIRAPRFLVGSSNDLSGLVKDQEVDVVIAATAAHWFSYKETWSELTRVVKPGGAVIWWTYGEHYLPAHPELQEDIYAFMQGGEGQDQNQQGSIGPYFPQPGRTYLTKLLQPVPFPHEVASFEAGKGAALSGEDIAQWNLESSTRHFHPLVDGGRADLSWLKSQAQANAEPLQDHHSSWQEQLERLQSGTSTPSANRNDLSSPPRLEQIWTWEQYEGYIRSSSALHAYLKAHPEEKEGDGDIVSRFVTEIRGKVLALRREKREARERDIDKSAAEKREGKLHQGLSDDKVRVAWPLGIMAIAKKA